MPNTANMGLPYPANTDPLAQSAAAIQALAGAVDGAFGVTTGWTAVTFQNAWANVGAGFQNMEYKKVGSRVYLRGTIKTGAIGSIAFTLPAGFRPPASLQFPAPSSNAYGQITIASTGTVTVNVGNTAGVSVNVTFEAA